MEAVLQNPKIRILVALGISFYLAYSGYKKKSLSASGAVAAIFVGFYSFATGYRFGAILVAFYYTSSKLTKVREDIKSKLELNYSPGGQRNAIQVLASSLGGTAVCLSLFIYYGGDAAVRVHCLHPLDFSFSHNQQCALWCMYIAHYACATADTWASELGVLSKSPPRLVTSFFRREVPAGTNGGMSLLGTAASGAGGLLIGMLFWLLCWMPGARDTTANPQFPMIIVGLISGLLGSLYDSLLGATVQASYYSMDRKCIVKTKEEAVGDSSVVKLCGTDLLSNEAVNLLSIIMTMGTMAVVGPLVFCAFGEY